MRDTQHEILHFWFEQTPQILWFQSNPAFDQDILLRFEDAYHNARKGWFTEWINTAEGCLALCILLDQFPRHMYRGSPQAYDSDPQALEIARHAVRRGFDQIVSVLKRKFIYLPFEHAEDVVAQEQSLALFAGMKSEDPISYDYAQAHFEIIQKFGRFPMRNAVLGRQSTAEELAYIGDNARKRSF